MPLYHATNTIAFSAYKAVAAQLGAASVFAKVAIDTVDFDTNIWFDTANNRYTPKLAGYYCFIASSQETAASTDGAVVDIQLRKNGAAFPHADGANASLSPGAVFGIQCQATGICFLNGTTDFVEYYAASITAAGGQVATTFNSNLQGYCLT